MVTKRYDFKDYHAILTVDTKFYNGKDISELDFGDSNVNNIQVHIDVDTDKYFGFTLACSNGTLIHNIKRAHNFIKNFDKLIISDDDVANIVAREIGEANIEIINKDTNDSDTTTSP